MIRISFLQGRVLDVEVEAPAAQRVADLARAVRRQHGVRHVRGGDGAELGNRHLEVGEDLQQEGLEAVVGPIDLVDQQDRRAVAAGDGAQQRAFEQAVAAEDHLLDLFRFPALRSRDAEAQHLPLVVPLVQGRVDVDSPRSTAA